MPDAQEKFAMVPGSLQAAPRVSMAPVRPGSARLVFAFIAGVRHVRRLVDLWVDRIELRRRTSMLNDHILRDIALTRAGVERELLKPFWRE
jgi:uncharacterized protein YjiS (DUF1127 family)